MKLREIFSTNIWKTKAIVRGRQVNSLNKRIKELTKSRDKAKIKNDNLSIKNKELEESIAELKNKLKKN